MVDLSRQPSNPFYHVDSLVRFLWILRWQGVAWSTLSNDSYFVWITCRLYLHRDLEGLEETPRRRRTRASFRSARLDACRVQKRAWASLIANRQARCRIKNDSAVGVIAIYASRKLRFGQPSGSSGRLTPRAEPPLAFGGRNL